VPAEIGKVPRVESRRQCGPSELSIIVHTRSLCTILNDRKVVPCVVKHANHGDSGVGLRIVAKLISARCASPTVVIRVRQCTLKTTAAAPPGDWVVAPHAGFEEKGHREVRRSPPHRQGGHGQAEHEPTIEIQGSVWSTEAIADVRSCAGTTYSKSAQAFRLVTRNCK
jgi:hypothetical protein